MLNHVKDRRLALGLTQEQLAERAGVSRQTIISIEGGRYDPSLSLAMKLATLLGERVEGLFIPKED
jgi:putative transcriptional regulator